MWPGDVAGGSALQIRMVFFYNTLVVHSLNTEYLHLEGKLLGTPRWLMPAAAPPHKGMFMGIPIGRGRLDGLDDLLPGLKTPAFERQRAQDLPPGFDEVEVGRIRRLIIDLLGGALGRTDVHLDRLLAGIALGADRTHLINV